MTIIRKNACFTNPPIWEGETSKLCKSPRHKSHDSASPSLGAGVRPSDPEAAHRGLAFLPERTAMLTERASGGDEAENRKVEETEKKKEKKKKIGAVRYLLFRYSVIRYGMASRPVRYYCMLSPIPHFQSSRPRSIRSILVDTACLTRPTRPVRLVAPGLSWSLPVPSSGLNLPRPASVV